MDSKIIFVELTVQFHSVIENLDAVALDLQQYLRDKYKPEYDSNILVDLSAGDLDPNDVGTKLLSSCSNQDLIVEMNRREMINDGRVY